MCNVKNFACLNERFNLHNVKVENIWSSLFKVEMPHFEFEFTLYKIIVLYGIWHEYTALKSQSTRQCTDFPSLLKELNIK